MHTALSNENDKFYTIMIYPCFCRSVCFSMGLSAWLLDEGLAFVQAEFPRVPMTLRSARARANFKCDVADVNK